MGTSEPIRDSNELSRFLNFYKSEEPSERNDALITIGLYTALRIGDILKLRWSDFINEESSDFRKYLELTESKTGKYKKIIISKPIKASLKSLLKKKGFKKKASGKYDSKDLNRYIFESKVGDYKPISRTQAHRIIKNAAEHCVNNPDHISFHSLRKTFGYFAWKKGIEPALLMDIYNHSSYTITKRYLGINQDEKDKIYLNIGY